MQSFLFSLFYMLNEILWDFWRFCENWPKSLNLIDKHQGEILICIYHNAINTIKIFLLNKFLSVIHCNLSFFHFLYAKQDFGRFWEILWDLAKIFKSNQETSRRNFCTSFCNILWNLTKSPPISQNLIYHINWYLENDPWFWPRPLMWPEYISLTT